MFHNADTRNPVSAVSTNAAVPTTGVYSFVRRMRTSATPKRNSQTPSTTHITASTGVSSAEHHSRKYARISSGPASFSTEPTSSRIRSCICRTVTASHGENATDTTAPLMRNRLTFPYWRLASSAAPKSTYSHTVSIIAKV